MNAIKRLVAALNEQQQGEHDQAIEGLGQELLDDMVHGDPDSYVPPTLNMATTRLGAQKIVMGPNLLPALAERWKAQTRRIMENQKPHPLGSKDGLDLFYIEEPMGGTVYLMQGRSIVALLDVTLHGMVAGVWVDAILRGNNLGPVLYLGALQIFRKIHSSTDLGIQAVKTWRKVGQYHTLILLDAVTREPVPFTWGADSVPVVDGKSIAKTRREFIFEATR